MEKSIEKKQKKLRRQKRIRSRVAGTLERPRLAVHKSNRFVSAQLINDETCTTIAQISSRNVTAAKDKNLTESAVIIGREIAELAKKAGIAKVVFDRGGYIFTGIIAAVAEGAREGGLEF